MTNEGSKNCVICEGPGGCPQDVLIELSSSWVTAGSQACLPGYVCVVSRCHVEEPFDLDDNGAWWADCMLVARALTKLDCPRDRSGVYVHAGLRAGGDSC